MKRLLRLCCLLLLLGMCLGAQAESVLPQATDCSLQTLEGAEMTLYTLIDAHKGLLLFNYRADDPTAEATLLRLHKAAQADPTTVLVLFASRDEVPAFLPESLPSTLLCAVAPDDLLVLFADDMPALRFIDEAYTILPPDTDYTLHCVDAEGLPVANVMMTLCDETSCTLLTSGAQGEVLFLRPRYPYDIHVISAPSGYQLDAAQSPFVPLSGGEMTLLFSK